MYFISMYFFMIFPNLNGAKVFPCKKLRIVELGSPNVLLVC